MGLSGRFRTVISAAAVALATMTGVSLFAGGARADNGLISCRPTRADVSTVSLDDLRMGLADTYAWATATVHVVMRDQSTRDYSLRGRADPIDKTMPANETPPGFAYPEFACRVTYSAITSVRNCHGGKSRRSCEIGINIFGSPLAYSVSMTAQRLKVREAELP